MKTGAKRKTPIIALLIICCALIGAGGSIAWLQAHTGLSNTFAAAKVEGTIDEKFDGSTKKDVCFTNTNKSDIPVYIRAEIVPTWIDKDGNATGLTADNTYSINLDTTKWFEKDGFYYYIDPVAPGNTTSNLIKKCEVSTVADKAYEGKQLKLEVIAQYIQAYDTPAVADAWGVTVNPDKTLSK